MVPTSERENSKEVVSAKKVLESEHRVNWPDHLPESKRFHCPIRRMAPLRYYVGSQDWTKNAADFNEEKANGQQIREGLTLV